MSGRSPSKTFRVIHQHQIQKKVLLNFIVVLNGYELNKINEKMEQMQIKQDQKDTKLEQQFMDLLIAIEDLKANRSPSSDRPS